MQPLHHGVSPIPDLAFQPICFNHPIPRRTTSWQSMWPRPTHRSCRMWTGETTMSAPPCTSPCCTVRRGGGGVQRRQGGPRWRTARGSEGLLRRGRQILALPPPPARQAADPPGAALPPVACRPPGGGACAARAGRVAGGGAGGVAAAARGSVRGGARRARRVRLPGGAAAAPVWRRPLPAVGAAGARGGGCRLACCPCLHLRCVHACTALRLRPAPAPASRQFIKARAAPVETPHGDSGHPSRGPTAPPGPPCGVLCLRLRQPTAPARLCLLPACPHGGSVARWRTSLLT